MKAGSPELGQALSQWVNQFEQAGGKWDEAEMSPQEITAWKEAVRMGLDVPPIPGQEQETKTSQIYNPDPYAINPKTGLVDKARVGVPAMEVPPPPNSIGRLPNLSKEQSEVESRFIDAYLADADGMADKYLKALKKRKVGEYPNVFATDDVKALNRDWNPSKVKQGEELDKDSRKAMAKYNTAVHQTANAVAKRAFLKYLDQLPNDKKTVLVTNGGCAAGKGSSLRRSGEQGSEYAGKLPVAEQVGAIWDAAGEQNATENEWIYQECKKRGIIPTFAYIWADPKDAWDSEDRGVIRRAKNKGRMVDCRLFADSAAIGAKNMKAFVDKHPDANFIFLDNRVKGKPKLLDKFPEETLQWDSDKIYADAVASLEKHKDDLPKALIEGGLNGTKIWGPPPKQDGQGEKSFRFFYKSWRREEKNFTGKRTDKLGRERCYQEGTLVPCHEVKPPTVKPSHLQKEDLSKDEIKTLSEWREHLWNKDKVTKLVKETVNSGRLSKFHPGEITVYRGKDRGSRTYGGQSWSKSKEVAERYAEGREVVELKLTMDIPALDMGKVLADIPSKSEVDQEVFVYLEKPKENQKLTRSQEDAFELYLSNDHHAINTYLRTGKLPDYITEMAHENTMNRVKKTIEGMDSILESGDELPIGEILYRGVGGRTGKRLVQSEPGQLFEDLGYMSTTTKEDEAPGWGKWASQSDDFAVLYLKVGVPVKSVSSPEISKRSGGRVSDFGESEIILSRGVVFRVDKVDGKKVYATIVDTGKTFSDKTSDEKSFRYFFKSWRREEDEKNFTGEKVDKLGRRRCYNQGRLVPCPPKEGEEAKPPVVHRGPNYPKLPKFDYKKEPLQILKDGDHSKLFCLGESLIGDSSVRLAWAKDPLGWGRIMVDMDKLKKMVTENELKAMIERGWLNKSTYRIGDDGTVSEQWNVTRTAKLAQMWKANDIGELKLPKTKSELQRITYLANLLGPDFVELFVDHFWSEMEYDDKKKYFPVYTGEFKKNMEEILYRHYNPVPIWKRVNNSKALQEKVEMLGKRWEENLTTMQEWVKVKTRQKEVEKEMNDLFEEVGKLNDKIYGVTSGTPANEQEKAELNAKIDAIGKRMDIGLSVELSDLWAKADKLKTEMKTKTYQEVLKVPNPTMIAVATFPRKADDKFIHSDNEIEAVQEAGKWLSDKVARGPDGETVPFYDVIKDDAPLSGRPGPSAYYRPSKHAINVHSGMVSVSTNVHEMGHGIEYKMPGVQTAAQRFLNYRVGDEPLRVLKEVLPGSGYGDWERGRKDDFGKAVGSQSAWYVGKELNGEATEVISMGIQTLYDDPGMFARNDPEYCAFILGMLDGSIRDKPIPE